MPDPPTPPTIRCYDAYIDSGTEWLGEVPAHWQITRIKGVFRAFGSGSTPISSEPAYYDEGTIPWLNTADLNNGVVYDTRRRVTPNAVAETSLRMYPKGTLAIAMCGQGETRGNVGLMAIESTANQASLMMHRSFNSVPRFMLWWFVARKYSIRQINIGATQPNMNQDFVRNLVICLPPLPEQQAIAAYLDAKTAQIDLRIDLLTQKAAKYRQLKQSLINEAVTRGLDKSIPMKDSGVAWIGEVPAHWRVDRSKSLFRKMTRGVSEEDDIVTVFRDGQVTLRKNRRTSGFTNSVKEVGYQGVRKGDLVIHAMDAFAGAVGVSDSDGKATPVYSAYTPLDPNGVHIPYFGILVRQMALSGYVSSLGKGIRERSSEFRHKEFAPLKLPVPPLSEQKEIASYINNKTTQIESILNTIDAQITKLKDLRKALINDVVTGKLRVT